MDERATVLVTGAGGGIGAALAERLATSGFRVRAMVRNTLNTERLRAVGAEIAVGDVREQATLERAARGIEVVMHLAAIHGRAGASDIEYHDVNVRGVTNMVAAASNAGARRFVHVSSIGVHGDTGRTGVNEQSPFAPRDVYTRSKLAGELAARAAFEEHGIEGVVLRPLGIYRPGDLRFAKLFRGLKRGRFPLIGPCTAIMQMCYMDTFVSAMRQSARLPEASGQVYIVGDRERPTVVEFVRLAAAAVGGHTLPFALPLAPIMLAARATAAVCRIVGTEPPLHPRRLEFYTTNRVADVSKSFGELGLAASIPLQQRVEATAAWYLDRGLL